MLDINVNINDVFFIDTCLYEAPLNFNPGVDK